jgi:hypothetical protein
LGRELFLIRARLSKPCLFLVPILAMIVLPASVTNNITAAQGAPPSLVRSAVVTETSPKKTQQLAKPRSSARSSGPIQFTDVTEQAGIHFKHNSGAFGKKYLPETMGSGVCFLDYDNDGWQDILFVNSMDWP